MSTSKSSAACAACESAAARCSRCGRGTCADHASKGDGLCPPCEVAYFEGRDRLPLRAWFLAGCCVPVAVLLANLGELMRQPFRGGAYRSITTGIPLLDAALLTALFAYLSGKLLVAIRTSLYRRRFRAASSSSSSS